MLSRTARPKVSGPPEASWASSKMMVIDCTVLFASVIGGNAAASPAASQRSLIQPVLAPMTVAGGGRTEKHTSESSHSQISHALFCFQKKKHTTPVYSSTQ